MRYNPEIYARSLYESLEEWPLDSDRDKILKNFWPVVKKNGDLSRSGSIIKIFEALVVKKNGGRMVEVETAREVPPESSNKVNGLFNKNDVVREKINQKLIAGVRIEIDGEKELDFSLVSKLKKVFS